MARNPDIAQVPTSPNVTVRLEWEKKDERGVLVFSDSRYAPISVEVEELKGTHQPQSFASSTTVAALVLHAMSGQSQAHH